MLRAVALATAVLLMLGATACGSKTRDSAGRAPEPADTTSYDPNGYDPNAYDPNAYDPNDPTASGSQEEWDTQEGEAWDSFNESYLTGWEEGCDVAFENSPDGNLYEDGEEFTAADCYGNAPYDASDADVPLYVPDDPTDEGEQLGMTDGCMSAFSDLSIDGLLSYGADTYDDSICP
jgi:hypothetical protein